MKNMRKIKVLLILLILPVLNGRAFTEKELVADGQEKNRTQERSGVPSTGDVDVASLEIDASRLGAPIQSTMEFNHIRIKHYSNGNNCSRSRTR